ncbi:NADH-ubiquinone oxidoreductase B18 subunit [Ascobolus immersus RN42]|uniref:NADH dehydrogenase [ubiquinone] 1 beta subcomplex subunit 7 n=1 Tax=Ascobolus immersus RN42 TaxID=1160509 RepID=A0A3N4IJL0_ASCIM|nr:NADH-ubiquinone oxidoreductase B18 subunit [Ascobolus immersus RN42]
MAHIDTTPATDANQMSQEDMAAARLPIAYRDRCAHLLAPLNRCRFENFYLPWKCMDERHGYEKCQYEEFKKRVAKMEQLKGEAKLKATAGGAASAGAL